MATRDSEQASDAIELSRERDFDLGALAVSPSTARVRWAGGEQRVEPRVMQVLVLLARRAGATVTREALIESCWGGRIVSDDAVARVVAQVRALARLTEPAPFTLETIPKLGWRLVVDARTETASPGPAGGAPFAGPGIAPGVAPRRRWERRRIGLAIALAVLALAVALGWNTVRQERSAPPPGQNGRVDVVAFAPAGPDPALAALDRSLGQILVRRLSRAGIQTGAQPVGRGVGAAPGGAELRVAGTLDRKGDRAVIHGQILDSASGLVLWSDRFEGPAAEPDALASQFSEQVAFNLQCALEDRRAGRREAMSTEVFGLYLSVCDAVRGGPQRMQATARKVIAAAPRLAAGWALYAISLARDAGGEDHTAAQNEALRAQARAAAKRALELDPHTPKAWIALQMAHGDADLAEQEAELSKALVIDPDNALAQSHMAQIMRQTGRLREAANAYARMAEVNDPRSGEAPFLLAVLAAAKGDHAGVDQAMAVFEDGSDDARTARWLILVWWGDPAEAVRTQRALGQGLNGRDPAVTDCFQAYLEGLIARRGGAGRGLPAACAALDADWRARLLAREGDLDGAFAAIKALPDWRRFSQFLFYPEMKTLRRDPRFWGVARSFGLVDYWRATGHWPDFCSESDLPFDCRRAAAAASAPAR